MEEGVREEVGFQTFCNEALRLKEMDPRTYSPLALAYIGDAVYELIVRTMVINHGSIQVNKMHKKSASLVNAGTQAEMIRLILEELTEEETRTKRQVGDDGEACDRGGLQNGDGL